MNQWLESRKLNTYSTQSVANRTHGTYFCIAWVCGPADLLLMLLLLLLLFSLLLLLL